MFRRPTIFRKRNDLFVYDNSNRLNENRAVQKKSRKFGVSQIGQIGQNSFFLLNYNYFNLFFRYQQGIGSFV